MRTHLGIALLVALAALACGGRIEKPERAALQARLKREQRLTPEEIVRLYGEIGGAIAGKSLSVREGAISRRLDETERVAVLGLLTDPTAVYDAGPWTDGVHTWRGITGGATPAHSELDASQTLWIDAETFLPVRYDFTYSLPGYGDYSYDLTFDDD
jgi:hypothetical protein